MVNKKQDIVILLYMTLECNIRCYYCVVNFKKEFISFKVLDDVINFIIWNREKFGNISIEFFWWEPTLVFDKIEYFVKNTINLDLNYKITTNWLLLGNKEILFFNKYFSSVYISFSNLSLNNIKILYKIYMFIWNNYINKYSVTFIYHPEKCYREHIKFLNWILSIWYKNINILPIYMYKNYDDDEFKNLKLFLNYTKLLTDIRFEYFYFIIDKIDLEFSIMPDWKCTLDSWETIYDMKNYKSNDVDIWNIKLLSYNKLIDRSKKFNLVSYMETFLNLWLVSQNYYNFMKLSNLVQKYK